MGARGGVAPTSPCPAHGRSVIRALTINRLVLSLPSVQVLSLLCFIGTIAAVVLGGPPISERRARSRVVAKKDPRRWAEATWLAATAVAVFWPLGTFVAPAFAYHWPAIPDFPGSWALQLAGFGVAAIGGVLFVFSTRALGRFLTPAIQVREDHRLVQEGPYRYIRHPVYTAILLSAGGLSVLLLSPVLAVDTVVLIGLAIYRALLEEALLRSPEAFGDEYTAYIARTGRFLPRVRRGS